MSQSRAERLQAIDEQIAKLQARREKVANSLELEAGDLSAGDTVTFEYGRSTSAEGRRTLEGVVKGVFTPVKGGVQVKVEVGEGYEAELLTTPLTTIKSVTKAGEAEQPAA